MKIKLVNNLETQHKGERMTGFYTTKKVVGTASKEATISRLKLKSEVNYVSPKHIMIGGVPHKMKNGKLVPMKSK